MSVEIEMKRIETFKFTKRIMASTNNGISSTLMNGRENQEKENLMKILVSMLKDHSMFLLK
jgi:hypothetical protein